MQAEEVVRFWEDNAETWTRHARRGLDVYRDALNTPAFLAMLPPVAGLRGLDVGCGEGSNTRRLAQCGARMQAIDITPTFLRHAQAAEREEALGVGYARGDAMALPFADGTFDFATAFMSLMDMPDPGRALREAARVLRPGGFLQFSILHPCFVPPHRKVLRTAQGTVRAIEVGGYFDRIDGQPDEWWFTALPQAERAGTPPFRVPRFHRTLSEWVGMVLAAGLVIEAMREPCADAALAEAEPVVADTRVAPLFLHVRARKPAATAAISLDHVQLAMPPGREAEARAFYAGLLGLEEEPKPPHLAARGGCWFAGGSARLHLGVEPAFVPARKAHPALLVKDLGAVVGRLEAAGHPCRSDAPLDGYERRYVDDPFGNRIELMQRVSGAPDMGEGCADQDAEIVRDGELRLLDAGVRTTPVAVAALLHDAFVEFGSSGTVFDKATTVSALSAETGGTETVAPDRRDMAMRRLGPNAILVTYEAAHRQDGGPQQRSLRVSVWVRTEAGWRMLFHQGTRKAPP